MSNGPRFRPAVVGGKQRLIEGREKLKQLHDGGAPGSQVCAFLTDLVDTIVLDLYHGALADFGGDAEAIQSEIAVVPHGGYGRRHLAPFSDVDLMLMHKPFATDRIRPLARQLSQDIVDVGLDLGFSTRTPAQACNLALQDPKIFSSLVESRFLGGSVSFFTGFMSKFRRASNAKCGSLIKSVRQSRREERSKYGDTVYLLKPNIKRSRGGLRDFQLLRWVGFARYGQCEPRHLYRAGVLSMDDRVKLREAREFLLQLRNEIHFHGGKAEDVLEPGEQMRLAELHGYEQLEGVLPVEQFMRKFFEITGNVRYIVTQFVNSAESRSPLVKMIGPLLSHQVERDFRVGPIHIEATRRGLDKVKGDLEQVLRLMELANLYDRRIAHETWQAIRQSMTDHESIELTPEAAKRFMSLMSQPAQLGELLRRLHQLRALERMVPPMSHARCLMQFNAYHKYTVDEHSIRAVERATEFLDDQGPLGDAYRGLKEKRTVHLALLLHDLGKGFPEDHSEVGERLAEETGKHLGLPSEEIETVKLLVRQHLLMNHLAFRRDIDDEQVVLQLTVEVGSPETLQMLYILSCADLAAVGPDVLNKWKLNLLTELYRRAMRHLAGQAIHGSAEWLKRRRVEIHDLVKDSKNSHWWSVEIDGLPVGYLVNTKPERIVEELEFLRHLPEDDAVAWSKYLPRRNATEYTIGTHEAIGPGIFHKLTGALTSKAQQILGAEINTLPGNFVVDRFFVSDMDYSGEPPVGRRDEVCEALVKAVKDPADRKPRLRRVWGGGQTPVELSEVPARVRFDNNSSEEFTIIDVFAHDRVGLLYTISRAFFEMGVSVSVAKIGTYVDQVVDVFYVTDEGGGKLVDKQRIDLVRQQLLEAIRHTESERHAFGQA